MKPRVAFVIHRFGEDLGGGIEHLCHLIAGRLQEIWDIEILTTCARDYLSWANEYSEGVHRLGSLTIRRFRVDEERDFQAFSHLTDRLLDELSRSGEQPSMDRQVEWMKAQGPYSESLLDFIRSHRGEYDLFVYFSYLYATTYFGLQITDEKSALVPAVHDEPMLQLEIFQEVFEKSRFFLFSAVEEKQLVRRKFGSSTPGEICAVGVKAMEPLSEEAITESPWPRPYLLYLGRVDHLKGCGELFSYFLHPPPHMPEVDLVLAGRPNMTIPDHPRIYPLGYVSEEKKTRLLREARALVMPSPFESLSLVLLEAWMQATPVIVNARCAVLKGQCARSGGGLLYDEVLSFAAASLKMNRSPALRALLGLRGFRYVRKAFRWENVERSYVTALETIRS